MTEAERLLTYIDIAQRRLMALAAACCRTADNAISGYGRADARPLAAATSRTDAVIIRLTAIGARRCTAT